MTRRHLIASTVAAGVAPFALGAGNGRLRIAMLGTAHSHAAGKMEALRALPDIFEVVGVAEPDMPRRTAAETKPAFAGLRFLPEADLLTDPSLNAVVVETTLDDSPRAASAAIRAGKHVHLDKPGAARHADFKALREEAERRGLTLQLGYMLRYNPAIELLFRAVRSGWLGEIAEFDATMGKLADDSHRTTLAGFPGAGMFELGCHLVDTALTVLGRPDAVHPFSKFTRPGASALPDNQLAVLEYPRATAILRCNHTDPYGFPRRRLSIAGTRGALTIEPLESGRGVLRLSEANNEFPKGESRFALDLPSGRYGGEFRDLAQVIRGEKKLAWDATHDIAVHETALRAAGAW
ncbi:MAG: Gfo/Idh/MocA family protein [Verrucomicrobiales bacterium]